MTLIFYAASSAAYLITQDIPLFNYFILEIGFFAAIPAFIGSYLVFVSWNTERPDKQ